MTHVSPIADFYARAFTPDSYPRVKYVPGQPSLCMFGPIDADGMIHWRPVRRAPHRCRSVIEQYADLPGAAWAREVISGYWSATLECTLGFENLRLECGAWNEEAYHCKQDWLREHLASQAAQDLPLSVPVATLTDGTGCRYVLRLKDGGVWLEDGDGHGLDKRSDTLEQFFDGLQYQVSADDLVYRAFE